MQIVEVAIHNFRSVHHETFVLDDYSLLIGPNNSGKSNVIDAIRAFYEQSSFKAARDQPRFDIPNPESWVDIQFLLTESEQEMLEEKWQDDDMTLRVRNYMHNNSGRKGFWAFKPGEEDPSEKFCSKTDVRNGRLGMPIYIPAAGKLDDFAKLSGPSPMRELVNSVVGKLVKSSPAFAKLKQEFETFSEEFQQEETDDSQSLRDVTKHIDNAISDWGASFKLGIDSVDENDIVKRLINFKIKESELEEEMDPEELGQGFQRNLIYTLIRLSAEYTDSPAISDGDGFSPVLSILLFEEPEAFLHPPQARVLSKSLQKLANQPGYQVLATSHSPTFVSFRQEDICAIARLHRENGKTIIGQVESDNMESIFQVNQKLNNIVQKYGSDVHEDDLRTGMEAVKYFLWLDSSRSGLFFAHHVLLVEGATERVLINHWIQTDKISLPDDQVFILECLGKYNIHRFMNLLGPLRIEHSVLIDSDNGRPPHPDIRQLINDSANDYTCGIDSFPNDFETFLGIPAAGSPHRKPQHAMLQYHDGKIDSGRIKDLENKLSHIIGKKRRGA